MSASSLNDLVRTVRVARKDWTPHTDVGKHSVQLNLIELEKWSSDLQGDEEEEEEEEEESGEEESESDEDEESEEESEDESEGEEDVNSDILIPSNISMINKEHINCADEEKLTAGIIPEYLRPKSPYPVDPVSYLNLSPKENAEIYNRVDLDMSAGTSAFLIENLEQMTMKGNEKTVQNMSHDGDNYQKNVKSIHGIIDISCTNCKTDNTDDDGLRCDVEDCDVDLSNGNRNDNNNNSRGKKNSIEISDVNVYNNNGSLKSSNEASHLDEKNENNCTAHQQNQNQNNSSPFSHSSNSRPSATTDINSWFQDPSVPGRPQPIKASSITIISSVDYDKNEDILSPVNNVSSDGTNVQGEK